MRIVIAEDNVLLSEGLKLLLSTRGHEVGAVAEDVPAFAEAVDRHRPDLALVDVRLPPNFRDEGTHAAIAARSAHPGLPVLVLSQRVRAVLAYLSRRGRFPGRIGVDYTAPAPASAFASRASRRVSSAPATAAVKNISTP